MGAHLDIRDLHVSVEGQEILKGVSLAVSNGEIHALMGPNGSGKSTLAYALMGHPNYEITAGDVLYKGESIVEMEPDERSRNGVFLAFQYPVAIPGVSVANFLRMALNARLPAEKNGNGHSRKGISIPKFRKLLKEKMSLLEMDPSFAGRYLNEGFSGGEKKRAEILQMAVLEPEVAILDETDSGLDIDALRIVANGVNALAGPHLGNGVPGRLFQVGGTFLQFAHHVFHHHDGVVDHQGHGQHQAQQGEHVDGETEHQHERQGANQ